MSVDKPAVSTELLSTNMVTATLHATGGFTGTVALAGRVVDSAGTAVPNWTVTLDKASVDVTANGDTPVVATVKIPSDTTVLTGATIKIDATTTTLGVKSTASTVTVANQISIPMTLNGATCEVTANKAITIAQGTKVHWTNGSATSRITIHVQGTLPGFVHEPDPGMAPTTGSYDQTANGAGTATWYCHAPGQDTNRYTITAK